MKKYINLIISYGLFVAGCVFVALGWNIWQVLFGLALVGWGLCSLDRYNTQILFYTKAK